MARGGHRAFVWNDEIQLIGGWNGPEREYLPIESCKIVENDINCVSKRSKITS